jgi:ankyrin repeat protein
MNVCARYRNPDPPPLCVACLQYKGNTPLHFCYTYGFGGTLGEYLASKGADTSIRNHFGATCFEGSRGGSTPRK